MVEQIKAEGQQRHKRDAIEHEIEQLKELHDQEIEKLKAESDEQFA